MRGRGARCVHNCGAFSPAPKNDHGDEASLLVGNHYEAAGKAGDVFQPRLNRHWKTQRAGSFIRLRHELKTEGREPAGGVGDGPFDFEPSVQRIAECT